MIQIIFLLSKIKWDAMRKRKKLKSHVICYILNVRVVDGHPVYVCRVLQTENVENCSEFLISFIK